MTGLFASPKPLIAMIHVGALPGTPQSRQTVAVLVEQAAAEARLLADHGVDAIMLENMHDRPYLNRDVGPEITAAMSALLAGVRSAVGADMPLGVQVLAGANREALATAHAGGAQFVRVEGFVFAHVADEGLMPRADAGELLRYRCRIGAEAVLILSDIKKKHSSHAITADLDVGAAARAAEFFGADAVIVTGDETGRPARPDHLRLVKESTRLPVLVGSGITLESLPDLAPDADGFIVGSYLKRRGLWSNPPDPDRVRAMVQAVARHRVASGR
ncbi:MAG: BtpA/SgcQ family protein [Phycisphaerales bacterium]|nr:MAG: BtpA/SgcQ family protein [Phycisphaerales bacterium]